MENKDIQFHITVKGIVIYEGKTLILKRVFHREIYLKNIHLVAR